MKLIFNQKHLNLKLVNLINSVGFHNKNLQYHNQDSGLAVFVYSQIMAIAIEV